MWEWPEEKAQRAGRERSMPRQRVVEVKDVLKSILNVVVGLGVSAMR